MNSACNASFEQLISAMEAALYILEQHPAVDDEIVADVKLGNFGLSCRIGGESADISECVARLQLGLEGKDQP